jgi:hypothetical protein
MLPFRPRSSKQEFLTLADVTIRSAIEADAADIAAIHSASWRDAYAGILSPDFLNGDIEQDRLRVWSQRLADRQRLNWLMSRSIRQAQRSLSSAATVT